MNIETLRELFEIELRYAYDCEQVLLEKGLPNMLEAALSPDLRTALEQHLVETRSQVARLERVFASINAKAAKEDNDVIADLVNGAEDLIDDIEDAPVRDAAIIVCGNKIEHYEMAIYGSLVAFANQLGFRDAAALLQETLDEEKAANAKLTEIGVKTVNPNAQEKRAA